MALTQFQIIQSLGKNLEWLQQELSWGVAAQELTHLTGRIGELYTAMFTYGQMAPENNQRGYDVISAEGERISVKTITTSSHVSFKKSTLQFVDRIVILRINTVDLEIDILVDDLLEAVIPQMRDKEKFYSFNTRERSTASRERALARVIRPLDEMEVINEAQFGRHTVLQYENSTIAVLGDGEQIPVVKPILRLIAAELNVSPLNSAGAEKNTRQLGDHIIKVIKATNNQ